MSHTRGDIAQRLAKLHEHLAAQLAEHAAVVDAAHRELLNEIAQREQEHAAAMAAQGDGGR